jgi:hypothetical protein
MPSAQQKPLQLRAIDFLTDMQKCGNMYEVSFDNLQTSDNRALKNEPVTCVIYMPPARFGV